MSTCNRRTRQINKKPFSSNPRKRTRLSLRKQQSEKDSEENYQAENATTTLVPLHHKFIDLLTANEIPYSHLIFSGDRVSKEDRLQHIMNCYFGIKYIRRLKHLTSEQKIKYKLSLPTDNLGQKTLFLDLDETLIHASTNTEVRFQNSIKFQCDGKIIQVTFSLRPYCLEFLESVSKHYEIYIFTASYNQYARAMMNFLNARVTTITGSLSRENCLLTSKGFYIKDIVRVDNRLPEQMLIVDNLVHSFGEQVDNGIPIIEYNGNPNDQELVYLEKYLIDCSKSSDIKEFNKQYLKLGDIVSELSKYFEGTQQMLQ